MTPVVLAAIAAIAAALTALAIIATIRAWVADAATRRRHRAAHRTARTTTGPATRWTTRRQAPSDDETARLRRRLAAARADAAAWELEALWARQETVTARAERDWAEQGYRAVRDLMRRQERARTALDLQRAEADCTAPMPALTRVTSPVAIAAPVPDVDWRTRLGIVPDDSIVDAELVETMPMAVAS